MLYADKIKMFKSFNKNECKYLAIFLFITILSMFLFKSTTFADSPPANEAYCYLSQTNITYVCGPGPEYGFTGTVSAEQPWGNSCTKLKIVGTDGAATGQGCGTAAYNSTLPATYQAQAGSLYQFKDGTCYIEGVNSSGVDVWAAQSDCSSGDFSNVAPVTTNMPTDITNQTPDSGAAYCSISSSTCDLVYKYINPIIDFLAAAVGVVVVISIVLGGIQYSASADNPQATAAARKRIANAVIAAVAFLFLWGFLQFIVPGGLLNG